ncbi:MAG: HlyD family secretion protein, partial [Planctomycetota bacterium]
KELEADLAELSVRATRSGLVVGNDLESLLGNFCETGQTLFYVADEADMQATAMLSQNDLVYLQSPLGKDVEVTIWGHGSVRGKIDRVSPSSTDTLPHFALAGNCGGPLAVQDRVQSDGQQDETEFEKDNWKLAQPRMQVNISLAASDAVKLHAGQTGVLLARGRSASLQDFLSQQLWSWVAARIEHTHGL